MSQLSNQTFSLLQILNSCHFYSGLAATASIQQGDDDFDSCSTPIGSDCPVKGSWKKKWNKKWKWMDKKLTLWQMKNWHLVPDLPLSPLWTLLKQSWNPLDLNENISERLQNYSLQGKQTKNLLSTFFSSKLKAKLLTVCFHAILHNVIFIFSTFYYLQVKRHEGQILNDHRM